MNSEKTQFSVVSDGTPQGTKVYFSGIEVYGVKSVEIGRISHDEFPDLTIHIARCRLGETVPNNEIKVINKSSLVLNLSEQKQ